MQAEHDIELLTHYGRWPHYPWCPVKRGGVMGCVYADTSVVYLRNVWDKGSSLDDVKQIRYPSLIDLVRDGWRVD